MGSKENPPRGGKIKAIRIGLICDGIHNGLSYEDIQLRLNNPRDKYLSDFRGDCSVTSVKRVINNLPLGKYHIDDVVETPRYSDKDKIEKHDLELIISDPDIGIIGVQVKSSITGISDFYRHLNNDFKTAIQIAIQKKLIIINGSLEDSIITRNFLNQFQNIYQYCKTKNNFSSCLAAP